jgi:hypothetical protein
MSLARGARGIGSGCELHGAVPPKVLGTDDRSRSHQLRSPVRSHRMAGRHQKEPPFFLIMMAGTKFWRVFTVHNPLQSYGEGGREGGWLPRAQGTDAGPRVFGLWWAGTPRSGLLNDYDLPCPLHHRLQEDWRRVDAANTRLGLTPGRAVSLLCAGHRQPDQGQRADQAAMVLPAVREAVPGREWVQVPRSVGVAPAAGARVC